jgi:hypothetical protein
MNNNETVNKILDTLLRVWLTSWLFFIITFDTGPLFLVTGNGIPEFLKIWFWVNMFPIGIGFVIFTLYKIWWVKW